MEKILITGTGRAGTTFLIKLFTWLEYNTGWNKDNYKKNIQTSCNSGMERKYYENFYILKNPNFMHNIETIIKDENIRIKYVIIPIRDYKLSAQSRVKNGKKNGGLWHAIDLNSQIQYYKNIMANYVYFMTKYDIPTIFIDFDKMINDKRYLFSKLNSILMEKNISYEKFSVVYDEVEANSKPKPK